MVANSLRETKNIRITSVLFTFLLGVAFSCLIVLNFKIAILFTWLSLWILALIIFLIKFIGKKDINVLLPFIVGGLIIRLGVAFLFRIKAASTGGLITPDEFFYFNYAIDIADAWKSGNFMGLSDIQHYVGTRNFGYHIYDALHFLILKEKLMPVISNVFFDLITGIIIFRLLREESNPKISKVAFILWAFNPHPIFWSVLNLKDTVLTTIIVSILFCYHQIIKPHKAAIYVPMLVVLSTVLMTLRFYIAFMLIFLLFFSFIIAARISITNKIITLIFLALLIGFLWHHFYLSNQIIHQISSEGIQRILVRQYHTSVARSSHASYSFRVKSVGIKPFLLTSVAYVLFPTPLNLGYIVHFTGRLSGILFLVGVLIWYGLLAYSFIGGVYLIRKHYESFYLAIIFPLVTIFLYGFLPMVVEPRYRLMIMPFIILLASIGLVKKLRHKKLLLIVNFILIISGAIVVGM